VSSHLFIIGAQRSGTTYLWNVLNAHPDVYMAQPVRPEPKYFLNSGKVSDGYAAYMKACFSEAGQVKWMGEKSTSYIEHEDVAGNIAEMIPDARILVILRDPIERAISNYFFTRDHGLEPYDLERALLQENERILEWDRSSVSVSPHAYIERGKYMQYLELWERHFSKDHILLLVSEQFIGNQVAIRDLYRRLDLDESVLPDDLNERVNVGSADRLACEIPSSLYETLSESFRPWNMRLAEHFNLELSCWRGMS